MRTIRKTSNTSTKPTEAHLVLYNILFVKTLQFPTAMYMVLIYQLMKVVILEE